METESATSGPLMTTYTHSDASKEEIKLDEIENYCRVCMSRSLNMKCIYETCSNDIVEKINFCTGLQFIKNDGLPAKMCYECTKNLSTAYNFKTSCLVADSTFRNVLKMEIKTEVPDYNVQCDNSGDFDNECLVKDEDTIFSDAKFVINETLTCELKREGSKSTDAQNKLGKKRGRKMKCVDNFAVKVIKRQPRGSYKKDAPRKLRKMKFSRLKCDSCAIKFATKIESDAHRKEVHMDDKTWVCEICGKVFVHRGSHYTHLKSHQAPQYHCEHCEYRSAYKHDLIKHLRIHTGVKAHHCKSCEQSYYLASNLRSHVKRCHEGVKPFACTVCERRFFDKTKLNRHLDSHNEIRRHQCPVCHSSFTRRCHWKRHLLKEHNVAVPRQRPGRQTTNYPPTPSLSSF